jgi:hypothetical protein
MKISAGHKNKQLCKFIAHLNIPHPIYFEQTILSITSLLHDPVCKMVSSYNDLLYKLILPPTTEHLIIHQTRISQPIQITWTHEDGRAMRPRLVLSHGRIPLDISRYLTPRMPGSCIIIEPWPPIDDVPIAIAVDRPQIVRLGCAVPVNTEVIAFVDSRSHYYIDIFGNHSPTPFPDATVIPGVRRTLFHTD